MGAFRIVVGALTCAITTPGIACEYDSFLFALPGETEVRAQERSEKIYRDYRIIEHFEREGANYKTATAIYLAQVVGKAPGPTSDVPFQLWTTVRPVHAFKGALPKSGQKLSGHPPGGLCTDAGDGKGAFADVGDWVVVFDGVPKSRYRPSGIDSFRATDIRTIELLDAMREFGKDLE